jgi:hypothetical protein
VRRCYGGVEVPDRAALQRWIEGRAMLAPVRG